MKPRAGSLLHLLAAGIVATLLPAAAGWTWLSGAAGGTGAAVGARFHAGRQHGGDVPEPDCAGKGCHGPSPHRKGAAAAFLNMHGGRVSCLACHGTEFEEHWAAIPASTDRAARLDYAGGGPPAKPHDRMGGPAGCERCHSEGGKARLAAAGWTEMPQGFAAPIPMRMLLEGGRRWLPDDVR